LLDGRTHRLSAALAARAVGRRSETKPARRVEEFARFASDRRRRAFAAVSSAVPLNEAQQARLGAVLAAIYGREVQMNLQVDPDVVGGLRIQVGDDLYDATVLARLSRARSQMVAGLRPDAPASPALFRPAPPRGDREEAKQQMAELTISPEEIRNALDTAVSTYQAGATEREEIGRVSEAADGIARVEGL